MAERIFPTKSIGKVKDPGPVGVGFVLLAAIGWRAAVDRE
jgi:hypothetical protein